MSTPKPEMLLIWIGVNPIGTKLLSRFCQEADACLSPAYLETDTDKNVRFYERFGFEVVKETEIFDVKNRYMWRHFVT